MSEPLLIARTPDTELFLLPGMANRHGLITGATGTGKTVTLQKLAESLSEIGVPVFMADVKGDLTGIAQAGTASEKLLARLKNIGVNDWQPHANPVVVWDIFGEKGHPVRATVSDLGPLLLARLLNLNDVQSGVLNIIFRIADDQGLLLLDFKDLRAITQYIGDNAKSFQNQYGNISSASVGAIQRGLLSLEQQGAAHFFGEPMLDIKDWMRTDTMVIAPCSRMGPVTEDERNGLINHSPVYGKYEDEVDRESAYEMLQKGFQASTEQQNNPPAKGKEVAVDDGILGGLKDILFGTTGPRGGKKDGVVQTMAKSAARQVTNQIVRGMLGSLLGGRRR